MGYQNKVYFKQFQTKKEQKQTFKASPRDGGANVTVATTSPRISKRPQRSQKRTSRDKYSTNGKLIKSTLQPERKQKQKTKASPRDGSASVTVATNDPKNLKTVTAQRNKNLQR
jgi:hypothetical protein